jgi:hypothetical protein
MDQGSDLCDQIPGDEDLDSPRNVGFMLTPDVADNPTRLHRIQSPRNLQIINRIKFSHF